MREPARTAAALRYPGSGAPSVVAAGRGPLAERIVAAAEEAGVPVHEDPALAAALAQLELGSQIPPSLYQAVAEILVWALRLDRAVAAPDRPASTRGRPGR